MNKVYKKCWPEYFEKILSGEKTFELRLNDFEIKPGDVLVLQEWDPKTGEYTGREVEKQAGYVLQFRPDQLFWSPAEVEKHGLQIISLHDSV